MTPTDDDEATGLAPWPGYSDESAQEREQRLDAKVTDAYLRGDLLYARAIAVAVAACEALARGDGAPTPLEESARSLVTKIGGYGEEWFGDTGGWTPK
jgi:hypothetical protein